MSNSISHEKLVEIDNFNTIRDRFLDYFVARLINIARQDSLTTQVISETIFYALLYALQEGTK